MNGNSRSIYDILQNLEDWHSVMKEKRNNLVEKTCSFSTKFKLKLEEEKKKGE